MKKRNPSNAKKKIADTSKIKQDILGVILSAVSFGLIFAFITGGDRMYVGSAGSAIVGRLKDFIGGLSYLVPLVLLWWAALEFRHKKLTFKYSFIWGLLLFVLGGSIALHTVGLDGGSLGDFTGDVLIKIAFGTIGAYIISFAFLVVSLILISDISPKKIVLAVFSLIRKIKSPLKIKKNKVTSIKKMPIPPAADIKKFPAPIKKETISSHNLPPSQYDLPCDMLNDEPESEDDTVKEEERGEKLHDVLANFNIESEITGVQIGPSITRYEISLQADVKLSKVQNLSSNIAMSLSAKTVRILTPIPGKSTVGVEVPSLNHQVVALKTLISSDEFKNSSYIIPYCIGKSVDGNIVIIDLADMPHILLAGATGSGKSVAIHALINSILFSASPDEVKFLLMDPKRVELSIYSGIPHLTTDIVTDPHQAIEKLRQVVNVMDSRYDILAKNNVANINSYNDLETVEASDKMPRLIVVIDELADLMSMAKERVENVIIRLAQMSRAVGIHLVLATQRPSVDVITGIIKANLPARIAFNVLSGVDARTILDTGGAEKLLGKGDMLFQSPELSVPERIQGAFISREEIKGVVKFLKNMNYECLVKIPLEEAPDKLKMRGSQYEDEIYPQALELVIRMKKASISLLQRKLRIGYNRAARIIDTMEENGIVSEGKGLDGREVLVGEGYLENL